MKYQEHIAKKKLSIYFKNLTLQSINVHYVAPTQTCVSNMPNRKLMCNLSNCSMIPEETHINGSSSEYKI